MMRGEDRWAVAVRTPRGEIQVMTAPLPTFGARWRKVPLLRGLVALAEAMPLGARALKWSAVHGLGQPDREKTPGERVGQALKLAALAWSVVVLPTYGARWSVGGLHNGLVTAVAENLISVGVLLAYAVAIGRFSQVRRLFENHGAEHKVVAADEAGGPLTPEAAVPFSTRHLRCGTSLLLVIGVVSAIASVVLGHHLLPGTLASPIIVFPLVAAISVELHLRASANIHRRWVRALVRPGLALQRVTTREPSLDQLEVAIVALQAAYGELPTTSATQPSSSERVAVPA